ncbi:MAG TPA: PadR family transcriptional regulator [Hungateiclostridium thermocellum]|uniref:Transcriptional regulator, PadR-like family n=3 Tax=Acetivibrio thermocellus TaxID=1515 RepID=A3DFJ2_ACET2|nr:transcriptional regulator, PadR-like family [Acetivibrio thermocellus ATCC 27405]ALX09276.1 transcriptional regulator, PadR-like family [Acetivibrio thermocellus AD2]ANV77028.1 transcriptional regulator, PadR-like family [Acetivibrio thermocellus DSM 2360]EIC04744.1 transcriptional regulator PadR family protein [Acetivibrio thermocellus YS]SOD23661.1 DNA-binding transcriptional regulator, PadR family [Acetivibrio thermocellus]
MLYIDNIPLVEYNNIIQVEYVVINMLKHGILGLLNYGDMTGYEIMKVFRDSLSFFWTANTSQIYRELNTLKKDGFVTDIVVKQTGKPDKKVFSITESGREELKRWLREYDYGNRNSPLCMKVFFSGELPKEENIERLREIKNEAQQAIERYSSVFETMKIYKGMVARPEDSVYWNMTVEYGIRYMKMLSEWCDCCIKILEDVEK